MDPVSSPAPGATGAPSTDAFSSLNSEQFVKIIFTELSKQDPLQPSDSKALLDQLSSLRNIQANVDLSNKLNALVAQNELSSASGLIGRSVSGVTDQGTRVSGVVNSVLRTQAGAVLSLVGGEQINMSNLDQVLAGAGT